MPVTTDACLFGALIQVEKKTLRILDIGTGTGLLALMMAQKNPDSRITAIELDSATAKCASANFKNSPWYDRLNAVAGDFCLFSTDNKFDLIISNPPFFENQLLSADSRKRQARHLTTLDFDCLFQKSSELLNPDGKLWLLIPAIHKKPVEQKALESGFYLNSAMGIQSFDHQKAHVFAMEWSKFPESAVESSVVVYAEPRKLTAFSQLLMKDFYLLP